MFKFPEKEKQRMTSLYIYPVLGGKEVVITLNLNHVDGVYEHSHKVQLSETTECKTIIDFVYGLYPNHLKNRTIGLSVFETDKSFNTYRGELTDSNYAEFFRSDEKTIDVKFVEEKKRTVKGMSFEDNRFTKSIKDHLKKLNQRDTVKMGQEKDERKFIDILKSLSKKLTSIEKKVGQMKDIIAELKEIEAIL